MLTNNTWIQGARLYYPEPEDNGSGAPSVETPETAPLPPAEETVTENEQGATETPQTSQPEQEEEQPQNDLRKEYSFEDSEEEETEKGTPSESKEETEYSVEFPENFVPTEEFARLLTPVGKELGIEGKLFGQAAAQVVEALQREELAQMEKSDKELKSEWGAEYKANKQEARRFYNWCLEKGELTKEDLRVFESPKGFKLLYRMSQLLGEKSSPSGISVTQGEIQWAESAMRDPNHPDYKALHDCDDHRFPEVVARYNRAKGIGF